MPARKSLPNENPSQDQDRAVASEGDIHAVPIEMDPGNRDHIAVEAGLADVTAVHLVMTMIITKAAEAAIATDVPRFLTGNVIRAIG